MHLYLDDCIVPLTRPLSSLENMSLDLSLSWSFNVQQPVSSFIAALREI